MNPLLAALQYLDPAANPNTQPSIKRKVVLHGQINLKKPTHFMIKFFESHL